MGAIIWLASYPKSGNTWMRAFLNNLLTNSAKPADINALNKFCLGEDKAEYYNHFDPRPLTQLTGAEIAALRPKVHELLTHAFPDSVFVKTHNYLGEYEGVPLITMEHTVGAIYMVRNPLDVSISYAYHFGVDIDEAIDQIADPGTGTPTTDIIARQVYSSWSTNVKSWTQHAFPGLLVVRYEDMATQTFKTFGGVAAFCGLKPSRERLRRAIANSSFSVLKRQENERGFVERTEHTRFFRKGRAGEWKQVLSEAQVARIIADHGEQMQRFGYLPRGHHTKDP